MDVSSEDAEEAGELSRLLNALPAAVKRASELLRNSSVHEPAYLAADAEVSKTLARISELMNRKSGETNAPSQSPTAKH
jgi:hypothetical protein